jgi:hypothetical protein
MSPWLDRLAVAVVALLAGGALLAIVTMLVVLAWIHPQALLLYAGAGVIFWAIARILSSRFSQRHRVERRKLG